MVDLQDELRELIDEHSGELGGVPWPDERQRWNELVFCILNQVLGDDPRTARVATVSLSELGILQPRVLMTVSTAGVDAAGAFRHVLTECGAAEAATQRACDTLAHVARVVVDRWGGKIQRYLRWQTAVIRDDLVAVLEDGTDVEMGTAVTHWLQNASGMPVSVNDQHVATFCADRGITLQDLEREADALDFNLALLDDVIRLSSQPREEAVERQEGAAQ